MTYAQGQTSRYPLLTEMVQIAEMGAYVKLLEYDNIDGMILLSELSRRRIRSIQKLIRVGRNEVVVVLRVDKEKGEVLICYKIAQTAQLKELWWLTRDCDVQAISICQNEGCRQRISYGAKNNTTRASRYTR